MQPFNKIPTTTFQYVTVFRNEKSKFRSRKKKYSDPEINKNLLHLFQEVFQIDGFEVDAFSEHEHAIKSFNSTSHNYDLIQMDLKLDGVDGRMVYKKFKEPDSKLKICVLTALEVSVEEFKVICRSLEEKYLIKKPVPISSLVKMAHSILK